MWLQLSWPPLFLLDAGRPNLKFIVFTESKMFVLEGQRELEALLRICIGLGPFF